MAAGCGWRQWPLEEDGLKMEWPAKFVQEGGRAESMQEVVGQNLRREWPVNLREE